MFRRTLLVAVVSICLSSAAFAHDPKYHKEHPIIGKVLSADSDSIAIESEGRETKVTFLPTTKFEFGREGKKAERGDLGAGEQVTIIGTKLESGEVVAKEVMIEKSAAGAKPGASPDE